MLGAVTTHSLRAATRPSVRLADLLLVPALSGARVIAEGLSLDRPVAALALADDPASPAETRALLLSTRGVPAELPSDCAGVVCREEPTEALGLPVIVLPEGRPWGPVLSGLADALNGVGERDVARDALRAPLVAGRGFPGLAEVAAGLIGAPVAVLDEYLDVLAAAGLDDDQQRSFDAAIAASRGHGPASVLGPFMEQEMPELSRVLTSGPAGATGVVVAWQAPPLTGAQESVVTELVEACALERAREQVRTETEARLLGDLVEELVAGEAVGRESLVRRSRHLGADLSRGAVALLGSLQDPHTEGRQVTDPRLTRRVLQQARVSIDMHVSRALVDWRDGRLLALIPPVSDPGDEPPGRTEVEQQAVVLARRVLTATSQTVPGLALTFALSRYTAEPERLGAALDEAMLALSIGERLGRMGEVVTFEETGTYKLLFQIFADRPEELASFYEQTIDPLVRYDEQYQTELVTTLATYLGNDCNLAATAGTLFTHRHTVRYRLDRIAELSGLDIGRTDDREKLSLGLKAMRLLGKRVVMVEDRKRATKSA
jgi:sugar diacid utilization regulator